MKVTLANISPYLHSRCTTGSAYAAIPCLLWTGRREKRGYGRLAHDWYLLTGEQYAHRLAFKEHKGLIKKGHCIVHMCLNRSCIEPAHLDQVPVTQAAKYVDLLGVRMRGEQHPNAKLSNEMVKLIRQYHGELTGSVVASYFNVGLSTVYRIWRSDNWRHVAMLT